MDGHGLSHSEIMLPITLATFDSGFGGLKGICGVAVSMGDPEGHLFNIEVRYPDGAAAVRLRLDGVKPVNVSSFPIDGENGEHIRGPGVLLLSQGPGSQVSR